jgi:hypothetical protein
MPGDDISESFSIFASCQSISGTATFSAAPCHIPTIPPTHCPTGRGRLGGFPASPAVELPSKGRSFWRRGGRAVAGPRAAQRREAVRYRLAPVLAVLLWIGASGAGRGAETIADPSAGKDALPPKEVRSSCNTIAAILTVYPTFVVGTSEGPVQSVRGGPERVGCRVRAASPAWGLVGEVPPAGHYYAQGYTNSMLDAQRTRIHDGGDGGKRIEGITEEGKRTPQ